VLLNLAFERSAEQGHIGVLDVDFLFLKHC
jgi:hypothetical protein